MKKALIPILVSCALMVGCGGTQVPAETETLVEETVIEETVIGETVIDETVIDETVAEESVTEDGPFVNENWSCDMLNYSEVPEDIQEMIRNYGSGDYENSVFLGTGYGADNVVTYAVMISIEGVDQVLYISVDESGEPSYELAEDYQTAFDEIVGVVAAESEVNETEASESLTDETEA